MSTTTNETSYYFQPGPPLASQWALSTTMATGTAVPDYDLDPRPGLTIASSGGNYNENEIRKLQDWAVVPPSSLVLDGPVVLELWSTVEDFDVSDKSHIHAYLDRCDSNGTNCTTLRSLDLHVDEWNQGSSTWNKRSFTLGTVNTTIADTQMLRIRLLFGHKDVWIAMNTTYPSRLVLPVVGP